MLLNKEGKQIHRVFCYYVLCMDISSRYQATNLYIVYIIISPLFGVLLVLQAYLKPFKHSKSLTKNELDISLSYHLVYFALEDRSEIINLFSICFLTFVPFFNDLASHVIIVKGKVNTLNKWIEYK